MSRALELLEERVANLVSLSKEIAKQQAECDLERANAQRRFEVKTEAQRAKYDEFVAQLEAYAINHRDELFGPKKKTIKIGDVEIGFRFGQPVIEIGGKPADKAALLVRVQTAAETSTGVERKLFEGCVVVKEDVSLPKVKELPADQFDKLGVKLVQKEKFFITIPSAE